MTIDIKLDTPALCSLFPEGSSARLSLQQGVVDNFTRRHLRGIGEDLQARLEQATRHTVTDVTKQLTQRLNTYSPATLAPELRKLIESALTTHVQQAIDAAVDKICTSDAIEERVVRLVNERIDAITIAELIRQRFATAMKQLNELPGN